MAAGEVTAVQDWLFSIPKGDSTCQRQTLDEWLAADPSVAAITDDEAEAFVAVAYLLRSLDPSMTRNLWRRFGVRISRDGQKAVRRGTIQVLRRWRHRQDQEWLRWLIPQCGFGRFPDPATHRDAWTEELFAEALDNEINIVWLVRVRRFLGKADNLSAWLQSLSPWAERHYQLWLDVGRFTLRRIVYPEAAAARAQQEVAAAVQPDLARELMAKDQASSVLRQNVRRLERGRKAIREQTRRSEKEARALMAQARGEVAAARRALAERLAAQPQELADQARRFEEQLAILRQRIVRERADFVRTLKEVVAHSRCSVLNGRTVTVTESEAETEICHLLVESLGGRLAAAGGEVLLPPLPGFAAMERRLRDLALERVLIKCDGLYRKRRRPGIAMAGFEAYSNGETIRQETSVVCCGPMAGSLMAEYGAVAMALSWLVANAPPPGAQLEIWSDNRALVRRLHRNHPARRKRGCCMLDTTVRRLLRVLRARGCNVRLRWVPRDEVHAVDRLCARAYRELRWYHRSIGLPSAPLKAFLRATRTARTP